MFDPTVIPTDVNALILIFLKLMFILGGVLYLIFSFVITRQVHIMKNTLITPVSLFVQLLAYAHLVLAVGLLLYYIVTL
ncbi:MAG: hypothetical protein M3Q81_03325 [bacterium]|nr:hypothetical protein [bacterium]